MLDLLQSHTSIKTKAGMCMSESMDFNWTQVAAFHNFDKPLSGQCAWNWLLNSFSKMYLVFGFCFFHFFKILFVFLSRLISRLLLTVLVLPISSPAKPLVMALFMSIVLSVQSFHSRAEISPFQCPCEGQKTE